MTSFRGDQHFVLTAMASAVQVRKLLAELRARLELCGLPAENCSTAELVVAEACNNIVEHAYSIENTGPIDIVVDVRGTILQVTLTDHGRALPDHVMPPGRLPTVSKAREDMPEGGFGWFLIRSLTKRLNYTRQGDQNRLTMELSVSHNHT